MRVNLPYRVECAAGRVWFEAIAAFNCERAAQAYAVECAEANQLYSYRLEYRGKYAPAQRGPVQWSKGKG